MYEIKIEHDSELNIYIVITYLYINSISLLRLSKNFHKHIIYEI